MQKVEGREKELPCYDLKEYAFAGFLRESRELGLAEAWERSPGPRSSTSIGNRVQCNTNSPLGVLTLGSTSPQSPDITVSSLFFNLLQKLKMYCMYQTAFANINKLIDAFFSRHSQSNEHKY